MFLTRVIQDSMAGVTVVQKKVCQALIPISEEEVLLSIKHLKLGKSNGLDGIVAEMFKSAGNTLAGFLTDCFNELYKNGEYPDLWTRAIIVPIHKKGDTDVPDN